MNKLISQGALGISFMLLLSSCEWGATQPTVVTRGSSATVQQPQHHVSDSQGTPAPTASAEAAAKEPAPVVKRIDIMDSKGAKVGTAALSEAVEGVRLQVEVSGLPPGVHGIHIHQTGVCTAPDFNSAGAHFNPEGKKHGFENPEGYHAGDLLNLEIGSDGKGKAELIDKKVTLVKDKANSLLKPGGTALVIHEAADDYKTDPAGNSGARIACGVIL
ncbi:superoxide dismutase family protein [Paenibacillus radicis (ex Xue et al. 2023)]|uniref:Superoxide dismutase [Cu-Zn] n=1 Tax=Paenibacillus radicis (ex Xue et al. 2023) TaxID=2972489 RepID=A0ABT1YF25_9BACL|nr:superoxide dismutase family protein [Paenibacillus radicis (ex Xue et al. 2023)]MCR8631802.1 superoxide dismutase family protein [Paenibacillus radicis (ex Xue et al. 2023)]